MTDDQLRTLLDDAVADVHPRHALADIHRRTTRSRRRGLAWGAGGTAVATAATVAAVVALTHTGGGTGTAPAPTGQRATGGPVVVTYFAGAAGPGLRLFPERHRTSSASAAATDAVRDAVAGRATDPDHRTLWPEGISVRSVERRGDRLAVDLSGPVGQRPASTSRATTRLAIQQLVYTADAATGSRLPVTFLVDGAATSTVLGEPVGRPVAPASVDATVTPLYVMDPAQGATVGRTFTVTGRASTFEANVQWELRGADGTVTGYATAKQCCRLSPYSFTVHAAPGTYTLTVHDEDVSDGEGSATTRETRSITVR